jgi:hypothetical protein
MGLGPFNDVGHTIWDNIVVNAATAYDVAHHGAYKLIPYGPLITPTVGVLAGTIALYSIYVTRSIARKRATIDFFLKTEVDKSILELFQNFYGHLSVVEKHIEDRTPVAEILGSAEYKTVHACLNMHELIAVGIENKVFDKTVAYSYWSGALVSHCEKAGRIIDFSRSDPSDLSAYISVIELNKKWKRKLDKWTKRQPRRLTLPIIQPGPVIPNFGDPEV